jgi:hypothetical protein
LTPCQLLPLLGVALFTAACGPARPIEKTPDRAVAPTRSDAEALFWEVFNHKQHARGPEAIAALEREIERTPSVARPHLLLGIAHVWRVAEAGLSGVTDPGKDAEAAVAALTSYQKLAPDDARVATWLAPVMLGQAKGITEAAAHAPPPARDQLRERAADLRRRAGDLLDDGVRRDPRFNLFGRMIAESDEGDERAAADLAALHAARLGGPLDLSPPSRCDPAHPPAWPFAATTAETTYQRDPRCWNSWKTPFSYEGFWLFSGDIARRAGDPAAARTMYENARKLPSYEAWPYRALVEERLARADADVMWHAPNQCIVCHGVPGVR